MSEEHFNRILTINSGSSSVKLALYHVGSSERLVLSGKIDRIGLTGSHFEIKDSGGAVLTQSDRFNLAIDVIDRVPKLQAAGAHFKEWLKNQIIENTNHAHEHGIDKPEFANWKWPY